MALFTMVAFYVLFFLVLLGVYIERQIVNKEVSNCIGKRVKLAYTNKMRLENLEIYNQVAGKTLASKFNYNFLLFFYKKGYVLILCMLFLGCVSFILG